MFIYMLCITNKLTMMMISASFMPPRRGCLSVWLGDGRLSPCQDGYKDTAILLRSGNRTQTFE